MLSSFYIKIQREFKSIGHNNSFILKKIEEFVIEKKGNNLKVNSNKLTFTVSILGWTWDYFASIDSGYFIVEDNKIVFGFSLYKRTIAILIMCFLIVNRTKNIYTCLPFLFVLLMNYVSAFFKSNKMLDELIEKWS